MNVTIGSAPDSWGVWFPSDPKQTPWDRFMDEVSEAGYEWIELGPYGYLPTDAATLRGELDKRGLKTSAAFVMTDLVDPANRDALEREVLNVCKLLVELDAGSMVLIDSTYTDLFTGEPIGSRQLTEDEWKQLIETAHGVGEICRDRFGLKLVFHPHAETHVEYEDQIERFLEDTDPDLVSLCFDTGHHAYRGGDPIAFMRNHHDRIPYLHLKSVDREVQSRVEAEGIPFATAVSMDMFVEPAKGAVDFEAFRDVLNEIGYEGWGIVEQDMYPAPFDKPLPIAKRTREYLREIGLG
ncbi:MAG: sugar phosphate isomerase/epimerase [Candidatus Latescibacteria bacterium]|jgi:inosose dehydratase|nr:sugar phosphate isomerase/epimerase [Candidatus Latescibacterota bacterium]